MASAKSGSLAAPAPDGIFACWKFIHEILVDLKDASRWRDCLSAIIQAAQIVYLSTESLLPNERSFSLRALI
jgi:hypothetical protein